ncbi:hypothetical protein M378DRAFT_15373 [Amanita muscaria Koide BX008]|uniref:Uncharacterized protein n=1 Tax=Amanita muscaria (strain Koide BX008) TaxID=946122 RepID=A0A0C2WQX2_AMAMK|nr:hypothetical protein M378DRAFT_15373 [Amanita muscaria Koide BX008]
MSSGEEHNYRGEDDVDMQDEGEQDDVDAPQEHGGRRGEYEEELSGKTAAKCAKMLAFGLYLELILLSAPTLGINGKNQMIDMGTMRPLQKLFKYGEVIKVYGRKLVSKRKLSNQVYVFQNDTYRDGFSEKDLKLSALVLADVNPDEIQQFSRDA